MTTPSGGADALVSVPALLYRNAESFGSKPAFREKQFGIWQSWTWAEAQEEITALALGLQDLGAKPGDFIAVIGRNRPSLYWSMVAAQMVGAVPVPLYQDAVAEEMAYVLDHCGARFVIAGDQEQVDKVLEVGDRAPNIEHVIYVDERGLRKYDHSAMSSFEALQTKGRAASDASKQRSNRLGKAWATTTPA